MKNSNKSIFEIKYTLRYIILGFRFWSPFSWFRYFGLKGLFTWLYSFKSLEGAYFKYGDVDKVIQRKGFQMCLSGMQFGWIKRYDD